MDTEVLPVIEGSYGRGRESEKARGYKRSIRTIQGRAVLIEVELAILDKSFDFTTSPGIIAICIAIPAIYIESTVSPTTGEQEEYEYKVSSLNI